MTAASVLPGVVTLALYGRLGGLAAWLLANQTVGPLVCAAAFALGGGLALLPTYALSTLSGWSFGFTVGFAATMCGFLATSLLGFAIGRASDGGRLLKLLERKPKLRAIQHALVSGGAPKSTLVVALVRLAPLAPFSLTNVVMAAAGVRLLPYAMGTMLGMAPRTAAIVYAASKLSSVDDPLTQQPWMLVGGIVATLAVAACLGWMGRAGLAHVTR